MEKTEVQKFLYKTKTIANLDRFENGKLFYHVGLIDGIYEFPINTVEKINIENTELYKDPEFAKHIVEGQYFSILKDDIKGAAFGINMKASELFRWIKVAIDNEELICIRLFGNKGEIDI